MKITNDKYLERKAKYFPNVTQEQWNDWHWQVRNRIQTVEDLRKYVPIEESELDEVKEVLSKFRMAITPYYLTLIDPDNPNCPIKKRTYRSMIWLILWQKTLIHQYRD